MRQTTPDEQAWRSFTQRSKYAWYWLTDGAHDIALSHDNRSPETGVPLYAAVNGFMRRDNAISRAIKYAQRYSAVERGQVQRAFMARHGENQRAGLIREVISAVRPDSVMVMIAVTPFRWFAHTSRTYGNGFFNVVRTARPRRVWAH